MHTTAHQGGAPGQVESILLGTGILGQAHLCCRPDALQVVAQLDVDHACDGIGTVGGRSATGDDVDTFDQTDRDNLAVNRVVPAGAD